MIAKALVLLTLVFVTLGSLRWAIARPRPRWVAPMVAGVCVMVIGWRFGAPAVLAAALIAAGLWFAPVRSSSLPADVDEASARSLLGVSEHASVADIRAAHRRLIAAAHPDRGGAQDHAARLNAARDVLLRKHKA